jgi:hypothetical protein
MGASWPAFDNGKLYQNSVRHSSNNPRGQRHVVGAHRVLCKLVVLYALDIPNSHFRGIKFDLASISIIERKAGDMTVHVVNIPVTRKRAAQKGTEILSGLPTARFTGQACSYQVSLRGVARDIDNT